MLLITLSVLRYIFLLSLFVFILWLVKWMARDLKDSEAQYRSSDLPEAKRHGQSAGGKIIVVASSLADIKPGESFWLSKKNIIGRGGGSDVVITDSYASMQHARIYLKGEQYWLEDMKSTNGTFLNEVRVIKPTVLTDGDRVRIGGVIFQFVRWSYEVGAGN